MSLKFTIAECPLFGKNGTTLVTPDGRIWKYKSAFYVCQECEKTNVKVTATIKQPYYIIRGQHICNEKNYAEIIKNFSGEEATVITAERERSIPPRTSLYNILRSRERSNTNNLTNSNSSKNVAQNSLPSTSTSGGSISSPKKSLNVQSKRISKKKKNQRPLARKTIINRTSQTRISQTDSVPASTSVNNNTTASEYNISDNLNNSTYHTLNQYPSTATRAPKTKSSSIFIRNEFATNLTTSLGTESFSRSQTSRQQQRQPAKSLPQKTDSTTSRFSRASTTTSNNTNNTDNIDQKFTPPEEDEDSIIFIEPEIQIIEECINNGRRNMPITFSSPIIQQFNKRNLHNFEINDRPQTSVNQVPQISSTPKSDNITEGTGNDDEETEIEESEQFEEDLMESKDLKPLTKYDPAIISFNHPSSRTLKAACKKLSLKYDQKAYNWWCKIQIEVVKTRSEVIKTGLNFHGFDCLSFFLTGDSKSGKELWTNVNHKLNKDTFLKAQYDLAQQLKMTNTFCEEHFKLIAHWISCKIGVYEYGILQKYGDWNATNHNDMIILVNKNQDSYAPIFEL